MALQTFSKQPSERYKIAIEWSNKLPSGASLDSGSVSAVDTTDDSDATSVVLASSTAEISGTQSRAIVRAGTDGTTYKITFLVTLDDGSILEEDVNMRVEEQ